MKSEADRLFEAMAKKNNTTVENVKEEIRTAIFMAMINGSEEQKEMWRSFSREHTVPTPEEAIIGISRKIKAKK